MEEPQLDINDADFAPGNSDFFFCAQFWKKIGFLCVVAPAVKERNDDVVDMAAFDDVFARLDVNGLDAFATEVKELFFWFWTKK